MPLEDVAMGVVAGAAFLREAPDSAAEGAATRRPIELLKLARNWREIGARLARHGCSRLRHFMGQMKRQCRRFPASVLP